MWLVDLIWPKICEVCGGGGSMVCKRCLLNLTGAESKCPGCYRYSLNGVTHKKCRAKTSLSGLRSMFLYKDQNASKLIWAIKYEERWGVLNDLLKEFEKPGDDFDFVAYVPMNNKKYRDRGYNQAKMIACLLSSKWNIPVLQGLVKIKTTKSLTLTDNAKERVEIMKGVFLYKGNSLNGKKVLLVDDVFTSGATMNEVSKQLLLSGAKEVWGWSLCN